MSLHTGDTEQEALIAESALLFEALEDVDEQVESADNDLGCLVQCQAQALAEEKARRCTAETAVVELQKQNATLQHERDLALASARQARGLLRHHITARQHALAQQTPRMRPQVCAVLARRRCASEQVL